MIDHTLLDVLKNSGNWMVRFDTDGTSYNGFKVAGQGEWNKCPIWGPQTKANCTSGGFFGQAPEGWGYAHSGNRFLFCETHSTRLPVDNNKIKVPEYRWLYEDQEAYEALFYVCPTFGGMLNVVARSGVHLTLPALKEVAGDVRAYQGASLTLPALEKAGDVWAYQGAKIDTPSLRKKRGSYG